MSTKIQQTSHHPFKSLSDSDLSSVAASNNVNGGDITDKKRVTINAESSCNTNSGSTDQLKSKTLPSKAKQSLTLKRTNSLKRSITLPR